MRQRTLDHVLQMPVRPTICRLLRALQSRPPSIQRGTQRELLLDALNAMCTVDVLDQHELEAIRTPLPRDNGAPRQEELPDPVPPHAVLALDLVRVGEPVAVP